MPYSHLIDRSVDSQFDQIRGLRWRPWVGRNFYDNLGFRLLIVGESHYAKAPDEVALEQITIRDESNKEYTREIIWECPVNHEWRNPTLDKILSCLFGSKIPPGIEFWKNTAFYNFTQRMMNYVAPVERPNDEDMMLGWSVFISVVKIIHPTACLFLGSRSRHQFWSALNCQGIQVNDQHPISKVGRCWGYKAEVCFSDRSLPITFIQHPNRYFSAAKWHKFLMSYAPEITASLKTKYNSW